MSHPVEYCCQCRDATGRAGRGEDSLYAGEGTPAEVGPLCTTCFETLTNDFVIKMLRAEVRRLQSEVERLPARRARPTVKTAPIAPPNLAFFGIAETDEEFAERAGRKVTEVAG